MTVPSVRMPASPLMDAPPAHSAGSKAASSGNAFAQEVESAIDRANAPILKKREQEKKAREMEQERIREVGLARYMEEQKEVEKMMKLLRKMQEEAHGKLRDHLDSIVAHFEENPPENVDAMYDFMAKYLQEMKDPAAVKEKLEQLLDTLREEMEQPDKELEKLQKLRG